MRQGRLRLDSRFAWAALMRAEASASGLGPGVAESEFLEGPRRRARRAEALHGPLRRAMKG